MKQWGCCCSGASSEGEGLTWCTPPEIGQASAGRCRSPRGCPKSEPRQSCSVCRKRKTQDVSDEMNTFTKLKVLRPNLLFNGVQDTWLIRDSVIQPGSSYIKLCVLMSSTCQCSEELASSLSGGSEGPWSIRSLFLKCSATPTIERRKKLQFRYY